MQRTERTEMSNVYIERIEFRNMAWDESNFGVSINIGVRRTYWRLTDSRDKILNDDAELLRLLLEQINLSEHYAHLSAADSVIIDNKKFDPAQWRELFAKVKRGLAQEAEKAKRELAENAERELAGKRGNRRPSKKAKRKHK
jgi:Pyruvate/2-oxoacid:ferredoxin oxidoreductase gamma subunit